MTRPSEGTQIERRDEPAPAPAFSTRTVRMPSRAADADSDSLLPRGFPTVEDVAACETAEEKEEVCDKADLLVERLEAKADSAEQFVDGPIVGFFGFLRPNAERNAEKARAVAEEAAAAAAALRRAAKPGPSGAVVGGAIAAIVAAGAALLLGGDAVAPNGGAAVAPKTERPARGSASSAAKPALFGAPAVEVSKGPYGVEAAQLVAKVNSGEETRSPRTRRSSASERGKTFSFFLGVSFAGAKTRRARRPATTDEPSRAVFGHLVYFIFIITREGTTVRVIDTYGLNVTRLTLASRPRRR